MNQRLLSFQIFVIFSLMIASVVSCKLKSDSIAMQANEEAEFDDPNAAADWEFHILKDRSGNIPAHIREKEIAQARAIYANQMRERASATNVYSLQGPTNIGGRSRCVKYDVRYNGSTNRIILAGGVTGGLYKSVDDGLHWVRKSPSSAIYSVTSIVQDVRPEHENTWYYSTGEALGSNEHHSAPPYSDGVFKSTDNGETWSKLPNSNPGVFESFDRREDVIWRLLLNPSNGDVYMAAIGAIYRSRDGGNTWQLILGGNSPLFNLFQSTDIVITNTGKFYAAFAGYAGADVDGVWTSSSGDADSWVRIAGEGSGNSPAEWNTESEYGRIVLASPPYDGNIVYAFVQALVNFCTSRSRSRLFKWNNATQTWTNLTSNLPDCSGNMQAMDLQSGYNMMIHVKPDDPNTIFIGAQNLYRSTDGFTTSAKLSQIGGYGYLLHPDVHWIDFKPGNPNVMLCATDGGIFETNNNIEPNVNWIALNTNFTTVQYYHVAVDPSKGSPRIIGGTQDNGTLGRIGSSTSFQQISGGDGLAVGISKESSGKVYEYTSYQAGAINRCEVDEDAINYPITITPGNISGYYSWYTLFKLDDDNTEYLYYCRGYHLARNTSASSATYANWTEMTGVNSVSDDTQFISALSTTRGDYNPAKSSLFIGYEGARVFRLDNPAEASPTTVPVNITGSNFPDWGYISSISVNPRNDDTVLVTFSNYGITNIWWTGNAHSATPNWINVERNLTLPSIRSSAIAVTSEGVEYFVGTSVGLFNSSNPVTSNWKQEAPNEIGNAVVTSLALRPSDNFLIAGTYGNAIWATTLSLPILPVTLISFRVELENNHPILKWSTSAEHNALGFEVQKSYDGINFEKIGFVPSSGNNTSPQYYRFADPVNAGPVSYYRLRIVDYDGQYNMTNIIMVKGMVSTIVVENPFSSKIDIQFPAAVAGKAEVSLFDLSGKLIGKETLSSVLHATLQFNGKLSTLSKGVYLMRIKTTDQDLSMRLIKQ